jgi:hypothetical protein
VKTDADYSEQNQVWAILCGALKGKEAANLLQEALGASSFAKPSCAMAFYTLRALSMLGGGLYDSHFHSFLKPWHDR